MKPTGVNMTNVKQMNRSYVLQLLLTKGAMSRTELANALNLTAATLTSICSDFIQRGLLIQVDKPDLHNSGRKKCPLSINYTCKYVVAISLHYNGHVIAITDLRGDPVAVEPFHGQNGSDPETFFHDVATQCIRMLWEHQIPSNLVLGVGVCIIGPVDQDRGIALHPFKLFQGLNIPVKELLEKELPFPVCVESNVCSFVTAEMLLGDAAGNNLLAVKWGPGVGSAAASGGVLCKDRNHYSTEIGHTLFYMDSDKPCKCGRTGCLETGVGFPVIAQRIAELMPDWPVLQEIEARYGEPDIDNVVHYMEADCPPLLEFLDCCARDLAVGVSNAMQVFPPDQVILYGFLVESDRTYETFQRHLCALNPGISEALFLRSRLEDKRDYIGPAAIAIKTFLLETGGEEIA